jgi:RNA polymerase sigma-70 factor (ECF subfamily)
VTLDRAALERIYRTHGPLVLRRAAWLLGNEADAQEALQDVFAALLRDPGALRDGRSLVAWLYRATTHRCLNLLRGRRAGAAALARHVASAGPATEPARGDALAEVRRLLAVLPDEVAAAAVYHHLDGMTYDEVAGQLGCSRRKVGYLLERAQGLAARARAESA